MKISIFRAFGNSPNISIMCQFYDIKDDLLVLPNPTNSDSSYSVIQPSIVDGYVLRGFSRVFRTKEIILRNSVVKQSHKWFKS